MWCVSIAIFTVIFSFNLPRAHTESDFPFIRTISEAINVTLGEIAQEEKLLELEINPKESPKKEDVKIVCPVLMRSDMEARNLSFEFEKVDWTLCSHVICVNEDGTDPWETPEHWPDYKQLVNLRRKFPHLKISLNIRRDLGKYVRIASHSSDQQQFTLKYRKFLSNHHFDGANLQIDDLSPRPIEFTKVVSLVNGFKETLDRHDLMFTLTLNLTENLDYTRFNISRLFEASDFVNTIYDFNRTPKNNTISDATESFRLENLDEKLNKLFRSVGKARSKIVMGLLFDGPGFVTTVNGKDEDATFLQTYAYRELCESQFIYPLDWEERRSNNRSSIRFILENPRSIASKVNYAMKNGLAGVAPFYISFDDHCGLCKFDDDIPKPGSITFPLLHIVNKHINEYRSIRANIKLIVTPVVTPSPLRLMRIAESTQNSSQWKS